MTHGLGPGKPGPRAAKPITPPYVENSYRIEVKIRFMLIAYLVLLCEFFWEFSIFHFCRPLVDIYWHPLLSFFYTDWTFFEPRFTGASFYIVYRQVKRCILTFHFLDSLFCVDSLDLYWTFLVVRHSKHFRCNGSYIPMIERVLVSLSLSSRYSCPVEVWQSFKSPQHISLCSLRPRNPKLIVLLNHTVFKSASAVELLKRSFSYRTWISSSLKVAEALGLLPLPFRFRSLCFDWSAFRVCSNWTSFVRQSP